MAGRGKLNTNAEVQGEDHPLNPQTLQQQL